MHSCGAHESLREHTALRIHNERVPVRHSWPVRVLRGARFALARLTSRDGYVEARAAPFDLTFVGPAADCITRHIYRLGAHEPHITRYLIDHIHLGPEDIALDVGANLGWYSVILNRLSEPGARIFAFEPDPENYRLLTKNLELNHATRVTPLNIALGDKPGLAQLHRYKAANSGRHSLLTGNTAGSTVQVPVDTLRSFWDQQDLGTRRIRFLKIDVEGFEYYALRGAEDLLGRCDCVQLEYSPDAFAGAGLKPEAVIDLLVAAGLSARVFVDERLVPVSYLQLARAERQQDLILTPANAGSEP
jgi:FkbM family methyltransferase